MSDPVAPGPPPAEPSWQPPAGPPAPPPALSADLPDGPEGGVALTAVPWTLGGAGMLILAMFAMTMVAAVLADFARRMGLTGVAFTLFLGLALSAGYLVLLGVVWLVARWNEVAFDEAVGIRPASTRAFLGGVLLAVVAGRVAAGVWGVALQYFDVTLPGQDIDPSRLFPPGVVGIVMAFVVAVVLAPLTEEIVFRGILLSSLDRRWGATAAIVGSSALFAAMHVSPYAIPPIFVLSLVLGWLFVRTRSLTVCIVAHAAFNGLGLAALYALKATGVL